jgi:hypothetical protein
MECPICGSEKYHRTSDFERLEPDEEWCDFCGFQWQEFAEHHSITQTDIDEFRDILSDKIHWAFKQAPLLAKALKAKWGTIGGMVMIKDKDGNDFGPVLADCKEIEILSPHEKYPIPEAFIIPDDELRSQSYWNANQGLLGNASPARLSANILQLLNYIAAQDERIEGLEAAKKKTDEFDNVLRDLFITIFGKEKTTIVDRLKVILAKLKRRRSDENPCEDDR